MIHRTKTIAQAEIEGGRQDYIDIAKGLGMLSIIWGHICYAGISNKMIYAFHIPLFFFLSGLVFSPNKYAGFGMFIQKRVKGLIVPYCIYSFGTWMIWVIYSSTSHASIENYWRPLLQTFLAQGSEGYLVHNVPLWFVMCLFAVEVIYYFISKLPDAVIGIISVLVAAIGVWTTYTDIVDFSKLPWSIDVAMMALPFYAAGSLLTKHFSHNEIVGQVKANKIVSCVVFSISAVILYWGASYNGNVSMGRADLGKSPYVFYGTAVFGVLGFMLLCIALSFTASKIVSWFKWIGQNSFRVMAIHNPIKGIVIVVVATILHTTTSAVSTTIAYSGVAFCLTLLMTLAIVHVIENSMKEIKRNLMMK